MKPTPVKLDVQDLLLEVTRKCNMKCAHCLRGDGDETSMNDNLLRNIFRNITQVGTLTFSGGEPSLVPEVLTSALRIAKRYKIEINQVYVVTNGRDISNKFIGACNGWHRYCFESSVRLPDFCDLEDSYKAIRWNNHQDEPIGCHVALSMDIYHDDIPKESLLKLLTLPHLETSKYEPSPDDDWLIRSGRADWNGLGHAPAFRTEEINMDVPDEITADTGPVWTEQLYIAADGAVMADCNLSYRDQPDYTVENISAVRPDADWTGRLMRYVQDHAEK